MSDQRNVILAAVISAVILIGFHFFYEVPRAEHLKQMQAQEKMQSGSRQIAKGGADSPTARLNNLAQPAQVAPRSQALGTDARARIVNPNLTGSISLKGVRFDDLTFTNYFTELDRQNHVNLLNPSGGEAPYYAAFGWLSDDPGLALPNDDTLWKTSGGALSPEHPLELTWDNGHGLVFKRTITIDANYLFTIDDAVANHTGKPVSLTPYASVARQGRPVSAGTGIEGGLAVVDDQLKPVDYKDFTNLATFPSNGGWTGFSDKYWLVAVVPDQHEHLTVEFRHSLAGKTDVYQDDYRGDARMVADGQTLQNTSRLFAGAKVVDLLTGYRDGLGIPKLDLSVDWGRFRFLTKPFFYGIDYLAKLFGNFGLGILGFTVVVRFLTFPLAYKTFREMNRMQDLTPKMNEIRSRNNNEKQKMQTEIMELYQQEKVNPLSGCLPMLLQIPIFLSLYKVLSVTIEMRHSPFYGWIHDLSAQDPTNIFNLFGLISYTIPGPHLGAWPLLLGGTMLLLQRINNKAMDPVQARMMMLTPLVFMFMMAKLPAGLVIYYCWSNVISFFQQKSIRLFYKKKYRSAKNAPREPAETS